MPEQLAKAVCEHDFTAADKLFLDTNIWLYACGPNSSNPNKKLVDAYSRMLRCIKSAKSQVYIDVLVMSEYINRCSRTFWNLRKDSEEGPCKFNFKDYRNSRSF